MQPIPVLEEAGGVILAENETEVLLLELFPLVAKNYLTGVKKARYQASKPKEEASAPAAAPAAATMDKALDSRVNLRAFPDFAAGVGGVAVADIDKYINAIQHIRVSLDVVKTD